jgi:hypothetical protein
MNICLGACLAAGPLPMPTSLPIRRRRAVIPLFRDQESSNLNRLILILSPLARVGAPDPLLYFAGVGDR